MTSQIRAKAKAKATVGIRTFFEKVIPSFRTEPWKPKNFYERIFYHGTRENTIAGYMSAYFACHTIGIMFLCIVALKYDIDLQRAAIFIFMGAEVACLFTYLFRSARVVIMVAMPGLLTSKLRNLLLLTIVAWAFQYPAINVTRNLRSTAESVACVQERVREVAEEIRENANRKLGEIPLEEAQKLVSTAMMPFRMIRKTLRKLEDSVNRMLAWQRDIMSRITGMFESCSDLARQPFFACTAKFNELYYKCLDNTFDFVCQPIHMLKKQCYISRFLISFCEWPLALKRQLEEGVGGYVKDSLQKAVNATKNTTFYKIYASGKEKLNDTRESYETLNLTIKHDYDAKLRSDLRLSKFKEMLQEEMAGFEKFIEIVGMIADLATYPLMIWPFLSAFIYVIKFNKIDKTDNYYINTDILKIDEKRQEANGRTILPLNDAERKNYIWVTSIRIASREKMKLTIRMAMTIIAIVTPIMFVAADILTFTVLDTGYDFFKSNLTYIPKPNVYQLKVSGTGFISKLLTNILEVFQPLNLENDKKDGLWRECFRPPMAPNYFQYRMMLALFIIAIVIALFEVYVRRLPHLIAAHYLPHRRLPRALFLYREIINSRKTILSVTRNKVRKRNERLRLKNAKLGRPVDDGPSVNLPNKSTMCSRCCRDDLKLTSSGTTRICVNCESLYCIDCFSLRKKCIDCDWDLQKVAENVEFYVDSSCSDEDYEG
uniref:DC_STAMP domain-containing protein n=1 Tax=Panagrellus redivivus TaxID=6233 RepID=A0A7E4W629_PANRE